MQKLHLNTIQKQFTIPSSRVLPILGFIFCPVVFIFFSISIASANSYQKIAPGDTVTLGEFVYEDDFTPTMTPCTITITDPLGSEVVPPTLMNANADGWHYYDYSTSGSAEHGIWPSIMSCGSVINGDLVKADKSFIVGTSTAQAVWDVDIANLTTAGSIGKALADNRVVELVDGGEILAGSGANNYRAKLYLYDLSSQPINADATPTITIKNASGSTFEIGTMDDYTGGGSGIYEYITTIGSGQGAGRWESIVTVDTGGTNPIIISQYFEVEASPARVTINSITDNTVPSITANFAIANEGTAGYEYHYEYCVVSTIGNTCGGGDDIAYGMAAEFINAGVEEQFNKTLTVGSAGTYYWKVAVYWGTEKSVAVLQFNAVTESSPPPPSGPGAGGGGGAPPPPPPSPAVCSGADFNKDGIVNSVDFSILLFFWKTQPPFSNACVDINKDGRVDSVDFSIMLYQWGKSGTNIP
jgi:hypothetical protein